MQPVKRLAFLLLQIPLRTSVLRDRVFLRILCAGAATSEKLSVSLFLCVAESALVLLLVVQAIEKSTYQIDGLAIATFAKFCYQVQPAQHRSGVIIRINSGVRLFSRWIQKVVDFGDQILGVPFQQLLPLGVMPCTVILFLFTPQSGA